MIRQHVLKDLQITPRLLDLNLASQYTSLSPQVLKMLLHKGHISRVVVPVSRNPKREHLRDLLFDRVELDAVIESWREKGEAA